MGASIKVLTHLALFEFESAILIVIVRGTDKTIPTGPKTQPQNNNDRKNKFNLQSHIILRFYKKFLVLTPKDVISNLSFQSF